MPVSPTILKTYNYSQNKHSHTKDLFQNDTDNCRVKCVQSQSHAPCYVACRSDHLTPRVQCNIILIDDT